MIGLRDLKPTQRRWRDLSKRRLALILAAAPLLPIMLGSILVFAFLGASQASLDLVGTTLAAAIAWSLLLGWAYLLIVSRWRGQLGRIECFILGIAAAASLPIVAVSLLGGNTFDVDPESSDGTGIAVILAILLTPFGLLGGWCLWRWGVRPAVTTVEDVAPVFD